MSQDADLRETVHDDESLVLTLTYESGQLMDEQGDGEATFGLTEDVLWKVVYETLARVGVAEPLEVSVLFTDDDGIRELNREYRGKDEATDVLSFPLLDEPLVDAPAEQLWQPPDEDAPTPLRGRTFLNGDGDVAVADFAEPNPVGDDAVLDAMHSADNAQADIANDTDDDTDDDADDDAEDDHDFVDFDDSSSVLLGDIAISLDAVARQASQAGHSAAWELAYLLAHGVLHLIGYDDHTEAGYAAMVAHQEAALASSGIARK